MKTTAKVFALAALAGSAFSAQAAVSQGQKFGDWEGVCDQSGGGCGVVQLQNNQNNQPVGRVFIQKMSEAGGNPVMIITVPLGVNLQAGLGLAVDTNEIARLQFDFCDPSGCNVAVPLQGDALNRVKGGNKMQVAAFVGDQQQTVEFSLKGITAAINAL